MKLSSQPLPHDSMYLSSFLVQPAAIACDGGPFASGPPNTDEASGYVCKQHCTDLIRIRPAKYADRANDSYNMLSCHSEFINAAFISPDGCAQVTMFMNLDTLLECRTRGRRAPITQPQHALPDVSGL